MAVRFFSEPWQFPNDAPGASHAILHKAKPGQRSGLPLSQGLAHAGFARTGHHSEGQRPVNDTVRAAALRPDSELRPKLSWRPDPPPYYHMVSVRTLAMKYAAASRLATPDHASR